MKQIKLLDKEFELSIPFNKIDNAIAQVAANMQKDLADKNPLFICILNGSFMFAADLLKKLDFPCEISFVKLSSYEGFGSTGKVSELIGLNQKIEGRNIVVLEDIVDTGLTINNIKQQLLGYAPADLKIATLLFKPEACKKEVAIDYLGLEIANDFVVGYGLDYNGYGRNYPDIYSVVK
jgi:hypoxanthine phosphoribosyltransferase